MATEANIASSPGTVPPSSLDFAQKLFGTSNPQLLPVPNSNNGVDIVIGSSPVAYQFQPPTNVAYPGKSYLTGILSLADQGANSFFWYWVNVFCSWLTQLQMMLDNGTLIVDCNYLQKYMKMILLWMIPATEFDTSDFTTFYSGGFGISNSLANVVPALRPNPSARGTPNPSSVNYLENAQLQVFPGGSGTTREMPFVLPLRMIRGTYFSTEKAFYTTQILYIRTFVGPIQNIGYQTKDGNGPSSDSPLIPGVNYITPTGNTTLKNLTLLWAVETDPLVRNAFIERVNNGISYAIPFVYFSRQQVAGSTQINTINIAPGAGMNIQKLIYSIFSTSEQADSCYDNDNRGGSKLQLYYTTLNGQRRQASLTLNCQGTGQNPYSDYLYNKDHFRGTKVLNRDVYQQNWVHIEDFSNFGAKYDLSGESELIAGLPLGPNQLSYVFNGQQMAGTTAFMHYAFMIVTRLMRMHGGQVSVQ